MTNKCAVVNTKLGWIGLGRSEEGVSYVTLPRQLQEAALFEVRNWIKGAEEDLSAFGDLPSRLQRYFEGEKVDFPDILDFAGATPFQRAVWTVTRSIPYGETQTYLWIAGRVGKLEASRAVGGALSRNPIPIIVPCHRVVSTGGGLGGFSGGLILKKRLLDMESGDKK